MRFSACRILILSIFVISLLSVPAFAERLDDARRDMARLRYDEAEAALVDIARSVRGGDKQEALYLLAGLKKTIPEAEIIYQEVIRIDTDNRWAIAADIELAKIQYALGNYDNVLEILESSSACRSSDEACYFEGLSAVMLKRYEIAKERLSRVRSGKYRPWAYLALAEVEMGLNNRDEACQKYRSMTRSLINPAAMYRYGECLEKRGEVVEAAEVFEDILTNFRYTPEALLASEKLGVLRAVSLEEPARHEGSDADTAEPIPMTSGFTVQFGSFHDRTNAIKLAARLKRALPGIRIDSELLDFKEIHRVRFGYFKTRSEAQERATEISKQTGEPCTIMTLP